MSPPNAPVTLTSKRPAMEKRVPRTMDAAIRITGKLGSGTPRLSARTAPNTNQYP